MTVDQLIQTIQAAPAYMPLPIDRADPIELTRYLRERNASCRRVAKDRYLIIPQLQGSILDLGCNVGYFAFAGVHYFVDYLGIETDKACLRAARALAQFRGLRNVEFNGTDLTLTLESLVTQGWSCDHVLFLSTYHHIIGTYSYAVGRRCLQQISELSPVMLFDMGQKNEPCNPSRASWYNKLPDTNPADFIQEEVLEHSNYTTCDPIGQSTVSGFDGRLLFRFSR